jgi:hypothetical protein
MKTIMRLNYFASLRAIVLAATSVLWFPGATAPARAQAETVETEFPYVIQPELGATEFAPGDGIVLKTLRGNRPHLEPGGSYLLEGTYTLVSASSADLAWYATSRGPSGPTPVAHGQHTAISNGSDNFRLTKTLLNDGWLHVSFYVNGQSHGGVYFGEQGVENTVLRSKGWSDFSRYSPGNKPNREAGVGGQVMVSDPANLAIMAFLGNSVPPPANLDAKYSPTNLPAAFTALSAQAGLRVRKVKVDASEFPFLVYGLLEGKRNYGAIEKALTKTSGYEYGGSVVGTTEDGSTYFSLNMIPVSQYPNGQALACHRRLMVRLQMLADAVHQPE